MDEFGRETTPPQGAGKALPPHPVLSKYYSDDGERRAHLRGAFDVSAPYYDRINRAISFGTDVRYRRDALRRAGLARGMSVLDVGCGTGLIADSAARLIGPDGLVVGVDPSIGMLREAARCRRVALPVNGFAEYLPFADGKFDFLCMSYALRHVTDLVQTFREYRRVLKPGGAVLILEMTPPSSFVQFHLLRFYMKYVVPTFTGLGTASRNAKRLYAYFWDSVESCVPPATIMEAMREVGFVDVDRRLELRIFSEYRARK